MIMDMRQRMIYKHRLDQYMLKYGRYYSEESLEEIENNFLNPSIAIKKSSDVLNQVYEYLGIFEKEKNNAYDIFIDNMTKRMDINRSLLEVGCGYYPSLAVRIAKMQHQGSVTAIDPKVVTENVEGINVIRDRISVDSDFSNFDMIYGLYPCKATFDMITLANFYDKDLCILACDCYDTPFGRLPNVTIWLEYIEFLLKESIPSGRDFDIETVKSLNAPLITTKKLKK